uniref:Galectin n=1 Tax=Biomphalaria glabrata TaxID=6526 RepID=A0A2C9JWY0_BIOGL
MASAVLEQRGPGLYETYQITIPYSAQLPPILPGTDILVVGKTLPNVKSFSINLCSGPNLDQDVALHYNPRFDQNKVVKNDKQGGKWGKEEIDATLPCSKDQNFEFRIKVTQKGYQILYNNAEVSTFNHRLPVERVNHLFLSGEIAVHFIQLTNGQLAAFQPPPPNFNYQIPQFAPYTAYPVLPPQIGAPIINPAVPFTTAIPGGLHPGKMIYISGVPNANAQRFSINLTTGSSENHDYGLHFDVRLVYGSDKNVVVRTHKKGGSWGPEEKTTPVFPFAPNTNFDLMILVEPNCFKVAVNNAHFIEFNHRLQPINEINHLIVTGDVKLTHVRFQ